MWKKKIGLTTTNLMKNHLPEKKKKIKIQMWNDRPKFIESVFNKFTSYPVFYLIFSCLLAYLNWEINVLLFYMRL